MGELDGWLMARPEGLFRVRGVMETIHEVALIMLLILQGSARLCGEEVMVRVKHRVDGFGIHITRIADIEGIAYITPLDPGRLWLVNNSIDFNNWNELYR